MCVCLCVCVCTCTSISVCVCVLQHVTLISVDVRCVQPNHEALSKAHHLHQCTHTCSCSDMFEMQSRYTGTPPALSSPPIHSFLLPPPSLPLSLLPSFPPPHSESCSIPNCTQCIIQDGKFVCQECKEDFEVSGDDKCERKYL